MSDKVSLSAKTRTAFGNQLNALRRDGFIPGNVYGKGVESHAIEVDSSAFKKVFAQVGETGIVSLKIDGEKVRPALVSNISVDPLKGVPTHVDFHQVDMKEEVTVTVPLQFINESPAEKMGAVIVHNLSELEVTTLPTDIPDEIEVNLELLKEVGDKIVVGDLKVSGKAIIDAEPQIVVALAQEPKKQVETVEEAVPTTEASEEKNDE